LINARIKFVIIIVLKHKIRDQPGQCLGYRSGEST
jgi:hypothetical protein